MSNHQTRIVGNGDAWMGRCACHAQSELSEHRWEAEDWERTHLQEVERARAHLKRTPSLKDQRDWFRKQAANTSGTVRQQWLALAEELDHRLGIGLQHDDALF